MCSISGVYHFDGRPVEPETLERMRACMVHRGPDDAGLHVGEAVGLSHNRLSILDLSPAGHQPMQEPGRGLWSIFNGEIYNFREIRSELERRGRTFRSECDAEVILHAYATRGSDCLERFNGMFAFAIHDPGREELFLARDRLGIKPLCYYQDERLFAFASETKALREVPAVSATIDREVIPELLVFRYLAGARALLEGVREVPPGHWVRVSPEGVSLRRYWELCGQSGESRTRDEWLEGFDLRLGETTGSGTASSSTRTASTAFLRPTRTTAPCRRTRSGCWPPHWSSGPGRSWTVNSRWRRDW